MPLEGMGDLTVGGSWAIGFKISGNLKGKVLCVHTLVLNQAVPIRNALAAMKTPLPRPCLVGILATYFLVVRPTQGEGEDSVAYKFQLYSEDDGRMEIPSHYLLLETNLPHDLFFSAEVLTNIMTGSSPTGLLDPNNPGELEYAEVEDQRWAYIVSLKKTMGENAFTFEYARSEEDDYISNGFSIRTEHNFFEKNTTLQLGVSYTDDLVTAAPLDGDDRKKESLDLAVGITQLLSPKTILQANLTYGYASGYLSDPYKSISKRETFDIPGFPTFSENVPYFENRPDERARFVLRLGLVQYFESLNGSLNGSYRFFQDDRQLRAHTFLLEWNQKLGDKLVISPYYRFYHQDEADYYSVNLDHSDLVPNDDRTGQAPYFSSDYRLSNFDAHTYGLKVVYSHTDWLSLDAAYERYVMSGNDDSTPSAAYPKAHVLNLGITARF